MFVRIAHGDDVIELAVEMEACIIDCISHLIAIDGTGMVCVIVLEDFLPGLDLFPEVMELLKIQSSRAICIHESYHASAGLQREPLCLQVLVFVHHCVEDILEFICTDLHVVACDLPEDVPELLLLLTFLVCVARPWHWPIHRDCIFSFLREIPLFGEDSEDEFPLLVGLVGGGYDDILAGWQAEALGHLPHVDVGFASGLGGVVQEEVLLQVLLIPVHLFGNLVDGEANSEEVGPQLPVLAPVLLHQSHEEAADYLRVLRVIVFLQKLETVLRVGPESVCDPRKEMRVQIRLYEKGQEGK